MVDVEFLLRYRSLSLVPVVALLREHRCSSRLWLLVSGVVVMLMAVKAHGRNHSQAQGLIPIAC